MVEGDPEFDGNPSNLFPLSPIEEAKRIAAMAGGIETLLGLAQQALAEGDYQWAVQLSDHLMVLQPDAAAPKLFKADALSALADELLTTVIS